MHKVHTIEMREKKETNILKKAKFQKIALISVGSDKMGKNIVQILHAFWSLDVSVELQNVSYIQNKSSHIN